MKNNNVVDSVVEFQKNTMDKVVEQAKKFTGNTPMTDAIEKGANLYNEWVEKQKENIDKIKNNYANANNQAKETAENAKKFFQNWMENQKNCDGVMVFRAGSSF